MAGKSASRNINRTDNKDVLHTSGAGWMMPLACFGFETRWDRIISFMFFWMGLS